jgi:sugar lactone lactonase YvrE
VSGTPPTVPGDEVVAVRSRRGRIVVGTVLALLIVMLGVSTYLLYRVVAPATYTQAGADSTPPEQPGVEWVRSIYGRSQNPQEQLGQTQAAVAAADGTIWVTDTAARTLMRFSPDGRYAGAVTASADASPLVAPSRIAVGPDGLLYIVETNLDTVRVLHPDGTEAGSFGIPQPVSVAVSGDRIVVGAVAGFAILEKSGKPIKVFGSRGKGDEQFDYVHGVGIGPDGNVYVADSYNNRLSAYDKAGTRLWMVRTGNPGNGAQVVNNMLAADEATDTRLTADQQMQLPAGLAIDGAGRIVVADIFDCTLAVFDSKTGAFIGKYGDAGSDDGQFFYPVSVSYDPGRDWFTVADSLNKRVEIVRIPGSLGGGTAAGGVPLVGGVVASAERSLASPWRAFLLPLSLVALALAGWAVATVVRRRRMPAAEAAEAGGK